MLNETHSIADWSSLSILLGIDNAAMQRIRQNKPGDALDQQKAIIMAWLNTGKASWAILVGALRHKIVGRAADGDRIAKAYPSKSASLFSCLQLRVMCTCSTAEVSL